MDINTAISKDRITPEKFVTLVEIPKGSKVQYEIDEETPSMSSSSAPSSSCPTPSSSASPSDS